MNMKKIASIFLSLLVSVAITSCSSDDDNSSMPDPVFPESRQYEIRPGEEIEINFEASMEWRLTSDKQWLKFIDEVGQFQSLVGKAGAQAIKVTVTDGALGFADDKAVIKLTMGDQTQAIAEMRRPAKERIVKMYTMNGSEITQVDEFVDETFSRAKQIGFEANFDWKIDTESLPEWLINAGGDMSSIENLCGESGQAVSVSRMALIDTELSARYQDLSGTIIIRAVDSDFSYPLTIKASGIMAGKIQWIGSVVNLRSGLLWDDKGNHLAKDPSGGDISIVEGPATCHALIRDNDYTCHFMEWDSDARAVKEVSAEDSWAKVVIRDGGKVTLQAEDNMVRSSRKLFLFLVPKDTEVDYNSHFSRTGNFNFSTTGYGMQLEQYGLSGGFEAWKQINSMKYEAMSNVDKAPNATEIAEKLGLVKADNIYERDFTVDEWNMSNRIHITPLGLIESWEQFEFFNSKFESLGMNPADWANRCTIGNVYDANYNATRSVYLDARVPFAEITEDCLYIVIRGNGGKDLGTFVIRKKQ